MVTYRFEWSDRRDFQPGRRTGFKDNVPEGGGGDTAHEIAEDLAPNTCTTGARAPRARRWSTRLRSLSRANTPRCDRSRHRPSVSSAQAGLFDGAASGARAASSSAVASAPNTDPGVAARPSNLVATASGSGVVLTWIGPPGATPVRYAISGGTAPHTSTLPVIVTADASNSTRFPRCRRGPITSRSSRFSPTG